MVRLTRNCVQCGKEVTVAVSESGLVAWSKGALVQEAFPELPPDLREMFVSGICGKCWNKMFGEEDGDETGQS